METKGLTCKIPLDLHNRITEEIRQDESTMSRFIEQIILEHYAKGAATMSKTRTLAFQVSEEFFGRIKDYLARYEAVYHSKLTQKDFILRLIEQALEEADEEFEAAEAAQMEDAAGEPRSDAGEAGEPEEIADGDGAEESGDGEYVPE